MGRIRASFSHFLDVASEEVACTSGILLSDANIRRLAGRYRIDEFRGITRNGGETVLRAEELEEAILGLRVAIGELPDTKMGQFFIVDAAKMIWVNGGNPRKLAAAFLAVADSGRYRSLTNEMIDEVAKMSGQRVEYVHAFAYGWSEFGRRNHQLAGRRVDIPWDGIVQLDRLFEGEHVPDDPTVYLDQRYIDYLAKNCEDMKQMHWRNFERLTTEFFRRLGYEVDLGPGTKDGGIDVRVWTDKESKVGPPIMLIQCKRTKDNIGIETVKAFWADIQFHKAESGLIATTAAVTRDSKAMCEARQYPLSFAEGEQVKQWSRSMWRLRRKGRRAKIPIDIANPVGLARFGPGVRDEWFKGWLQVATRDYFQRFGPNPDEEYTF
ncbi:MAG: restriction endonuclease [Bryobacteraceae bacterium]|jgi:restriction system protein